MSAREMHALAIVLAGAVVAVVALFVDTVNTRNWVDPMIAGGPMVVVVVVLEVVTRRWSR